CIDRCQQSPGWFLTRPAALAKQLTASVGFTFPEFRVHGISVGAGLVVGTCSRFLHPSDASVVGRAHEDVSELGIRRNAAPICAAYSSRENHAGYRWRIRRSVGPRRERTFVIESAAFLDEFPTGLRVFFGCVLSRD